MTEPAQTTRTGEAGAVEQPPQEQPLPRLGLREAIRPVVSAGGDLARACANISLGHGPVALDAERASGYRYSQRAYLVQVRREGAGSYLVDPTAFENLIDLDEAIGRAEWILHAATQDLPCLAEIGMRPTSLFDTELAGRLLNLPRVGLASLVEHYLDMSLAKEYSAADWSTRPLPEPWLEYAALDVEVLVELRNLVEADLERTGKLAWAREEFESLLSYAGPPERVDPWRRTSGIHKLRDRRALAVVRSLWYARDEIAEQRDITPGRILPDTSILALAQQVPADLAALRASRPMKPRGPRRFLSHWHDAIEQALTLPDTELPTSSPRQDVPPPPRSWADKDPAAARRLVGAKQVVTRLAEQWDLPAENLISPGLVRQLAWQPPTPADAGGIEAALLASGARRWQVGLVTAPLVDAFAAADS